MSIRGIGDGYAFQRLLWLMIGTVIVPTVLLSLFGAVAIRNQQAAIIQQLSAEREDRLRLVARDLFGDLERLDLRVRSEVEACSRDACTVELDGVSTVWTWQVGAPAPDELLALGLPVPRGPGTTWFLPHDGSDPVGTFEAGPRRAAWRLDLQDLRTLLTQRAADRLGPGAVVELEGAPAGPATPFDEMVDRWQRPRAELLLQRPLAQWRLVLSYPDGDPAEAILGRTAWLFPLGLVSLVAVVVIGTAVTLVSAAREIRLSRLQTDFVSNVSHDLRTPLTSIRMFVETLEGGRLRDPDRINECLGLLSKEVDRLSRMIERVLNWAKMEAGRRIYEMEDCHAHDLVRDAVQALRSQLLLTGAADDVHVQLPDDLPMLRVDRDAIVEALLNLLQNAVKYTPPPQRILVSATVRGGVVGLSVTDNGPGVPKHDRKRIFEKFYQADTRLSAAVFGGADRGSGLGLSIVRAVARGHGGRVALDTELGRGSRFTLWLPVAR